MDEYRQKAYEDIACIRDILNRTAADFKELASFFISMGLIWFADVVLSIGLNVWNIAYTLRYVAGTLVDIHNHMFVINLAGQCKDYFFLAAWIVVYILCRRKGMKQDAISRKLMCFWGLCLFLYIGASVVVRAIPAIQVQMLHKGILDERMADQGTILYGAMFVERCLNLIFPILPMLLTSVFLENRTMKSLGLAAAVLVLLWIFVPGTSVSLENSVPAELLREMLWKRGLVTVIQTIPAVVLLAFGLNLKKT